MLGNVGVFFLTSNAVAFVNGGWCFRSVIPCLRVVAGGRGRNPRRHRVAKSMQSVAIDVIVSVMGGGAVAQSIERATPGKEVLGFIPAVAARSLLVGSVSV